MDADHVLEGTVSVSQFIQGLANFQQIGAVRHYKTLVIDLGRYTTNGRKSRYYFELFFNHD